MNYTSKPINIKMHYDMKGIIFIIWLISFELGFG